MIGEFRVTTLFANVGLFFNQCHETTKKKNQLKLLQALTEVAGEGGGMFDNSKKMNLEVIFYWTRQA